MRSCPLRLFRAENINLHGRAYQMQKVLLRVNACPPAMHVLFLSAILKGCLLLFAPRFVSFNLCGRSSLLAVFSFANSILAEREKLITLFLIVAVIWHHKWLRIPEIFKKLFFYKIFVFWICKNNFFFNFIKILFHCKYERPLHFKHFCFQPMFLDIGIQITWSIFNILECFFLTIDDWFPYSMTEDF